MRMHGLELFVLRTEPLLTLRQQHLPHFTATTIPRPMSERTLLFCTSLPQRAGLATILALAPFELYHSRRQQDEQETLRQRYYELIRQGAGA